MSKKAKSDDVLITDGAGSYLDGMDGNALEWTSERRNAWRMPRARAERCAKEWAKLSPSPLVLEPA